MCPCCLFDDVRAGDELALSIDGEACADDNFIGIENLHRKRAYRLKPDIVADCLHNPSSPN
jgi:hypothetical protein